MRDRSAPIKPSGGRPLSNLHGVFKALLRNIWGSALSGRVADGEFNHRGFFHYCQDGATCSWARRFVCLRVCLWLSLVCVRVCMHLCMNVSCWWKGVIKLSFRRGWQPGDGSVITANQSPVTEREKEWGGIEGGRGRTEREKYFRKPKNPWVWRRNNNKMKAAVKECPALQFGPGPPLSPAQLLFVWQKGLCLAVKHKPKKPRKWGAAPPQKAHAHTPPHNQKMF